MKPQSAARTIRLAAEYHTEALNLRSAAAMLTDRFKTDGKFTSDAVHDAVCHMQNDAYEYENCAGYFFSDAKIEAHLTTMENNQS